MDLFITSISLLSHLFFLSSLLFSSSSLVFADRTAQKQCVYDQFSALLQLKQGFDFSYVIRNTTLSTWNLDNRDCCSWEGITCDVSNSYVTRLDLSGLLISGQIDSQSISHLWSLQRLNLAHTSFDFVPFPSGLGQLTSLTHLNLSFAGFIGKIPMEISRLTSLVLLDLTSFHEGLEIPSIGSLVKNLTSLREIHLDYVNISAEGREWGEALSSLHHLRKLSLFDCCLSGPIPPSLSQLHSLTELDLSHNNLSSVVPDFIGNFSCLTSLRLYNCGLLGRFPNTIFKLSSLKTLDVSDNLLTAQLPEFPQNSSLQQLDLSYNGFSGKLPDSLNLRFLTTLTLRNCNFSGSLPSSLANSTRLENLDLSFNSFSGSIPSSYGNELLNLKEIYLESNSLSGTIHSSLFSIPSLQWLELESNQLSGLLGEFHNASHSQLEGIYLHHNNLMGMIPRSIFEFKKLEDISLAFNNFSGDVDLGLLINLKNLSELDLSDNNLSIEDVSGNSTFIRFHQLRSVSLRSCNIKEFPSFLRNQESLEHIDLSNNRINGEIPQWIWKMGNGFLRYLNLSHNLLNGVEPPISHISLSELLYLDLSSNMIKGSFLIPSTTIFFFSLSNNSFTGEIPESICNATLLNLLDLSHNHFSGWIPPCLGEMIFLTVLNLGGNDFRSWQFASDIYREMSSTDS